MLGDPEVLLPELDEDPPLEPPPPEDPPEELLLPWEEPPPDELPIDAVDPRSDAG
jgi:hypothetical protein